jgi:exopolysaccharide production protein ExoZ
MPERQSHSSTTTGELVGVQMLRGVAAFAVLVHHALEESQPLWTGGPLHPSLVVVGAAGVDIFFVISGFIMLHSTWDRFGQPGAAAEFLRRRLVRIVPLYWLCIAFVLLLAATGRFYKSKTFSPSSILNSLTFLPTDNLVHTVGWTLQYEMYFYLLFAIALATVSRRRALLVIPAVLVSVSAFATAMPKSPAQHFLANPIALEFAFGVAVAVLYRTNPATHVPARLIVFAAGAAFIAAASWAPRVGTEGLDASVRFVVWGLPAAALVWSATTLNDATIGWRRPLAYLGTISYSLYLTHAFVMTAYAAAIKTPSVANHLPPVLGIIIAVVVSIVVSYFSYQWLERPLTERLRIVARTPHVPTKASATHPTRPLRPLS